MSVSQKTSPSVKIFFAVVILGLIGFGFGALKSYFDQRAVTQNLVAKGVETEADVRSVTTTHRFRAGISTSLSVSFDPRGPELLTFADVQVCTEADYEEGIETVRIVYAPNDPENRTSGGMCVLGGFAIGPHLRRLIPGPGSVLLVAGHPAPEEPTAPHER